MLCAVYKSRKKAETYLFIERREDFSRVPEALMSTFGRPELVLMTKLDPAKPLGIASTEAGDGSLAEPGLLPAGASATGKSAGAAQGTIKGRPLMQGRPVLLLLGALLSASAQAGADFDHYVTSLKQQALAAGIQPATVTATFADIRLIEAAMKHDKNQPEFKLTLDS